MCGSGGPPRIEEVLGDIRRLVNNLIHRCRIRNNEKAQEAFQEGLVGALEAYEKFDPKKATGSFTSYAYVFILKRVYGYVREDIINNVWNLPDASDKETIDVEEMIESTAKLRVAAKRNTSKYKVEAILEGRTNHSDEDRDKLWKRIQKEKLLLSNLKKDLEFQYRAIERPVAPEGEQETVKKENRLILSECYKKLTRREQEVLLNFYWKDLENQEIAEELQVTEGRVSQLHGQGLARLKRCVERKR